MSTEKPLLPSLWDDSTAQGKTEAELLLYRSNLLGSDKRITNFGGGNTSAKIEETDPLSGDKTEVLWVKGSGGDIGSMPLEGFATLYQHKLESLKAVYDRIGDEDLMVSYLPHCTFNLNTRAASIDTPLHAFLPYRHVDHVHPDAVIAIAATSNSRELTEVIYGGEIGWLPWKRPGFKLGLMLEQFARENPSKRGVLLEAHGLFTWGDSAKSCYENTVATINQSQQWLDEKKAQVDIFGGQKQVPLGQSQRTHIAASLMPLLRGLVSADELKVGHFDDSEAVLEFVSSHDLERLSNIGTSCPDHFLRTKIAPLVLPETLPKDDPVLLKEQLTHLISEYREHYQAYYQRCAHSDSPAMRDPNPVIILVPHVGLIAFARNKATARIASEFYINAINVMAGAEAIGQYRGLPEQEAFDIEYWSLEEAKIQRMPKPKSLAGKIALVTGGAGGIGKATAIRLLSEGAVVVLSDIDEDNLFKAKEALASEYGQDAVRTVVSDVTNEASVAAAFAYTCHEYGGLDILISNAGIASSAPIDETTLPMWQHNMNILSTGYFLVSKTAFEIAKIQGLGGSFVFIVSKNGLVASPNAAAYCTAKASEIQLARCLALEGAPLGIRVNTVNPDAVLRGSKIWTGKWREERAAAYQMDSDDLEEHYRNRSLLKRNVYPEDIANAVYYFVSEQSSKSTGNILNVDAGHAPSFTR